MRTNSNHWTRKPLLILLATLTLVVFGACASNDNPDQEVSDEYGVAKTSDPLGPPGHVESDTGKVHASSASGGAGNAAGSGMNTNLNPAYEEPAKVTVTQTVTEPEVEMTVDADADFDMDDDMDMDVDVTPRKTTKKE